MGRDSERETQGQKKSLCGNTRTHKTLKAKPQHPHPNHASPGTSKTRESRLRNQQGTRERPLQVGRLRLPHSPVVLQAWRLHVKLRA